MTDKEKEMLLDLQAFIEHCIEQDADFWWALHNLRHDVNGAVYHKDTGLEDTFVPRSNGYADAQLNQELEHMLEEHEQFKAERREERHG